MSETKFCKDCRWHNRGRCMHEKALSPKGSDDYAIWLVTGNGERPDEFVHFYCAVMRKYDCGHDGKLFEPLPVKAVA